MKPEDHWEKVYKEQDPTAEVSWYQARPAKSLEWILASGISREAAVIDVGAGASSLVDCLLDEGFQNVSVLDISGAALEYARKRLGARAPMVNWLRVSVTEFDPPQPYALWHDRAVFHFLTSDEDRRKYLGVLRRALQPGGHLVLATFAENGPERCSGLPVMRYGLQSIAAELGPEFSLIGNQHETHLTPWGTKQEFHWFHFQRSKSSQLSGSASR